MYDYTPQIWYAILIALTIFGATQIWGVKEGLQTVAFLAIVFGLLMCVIFGAFTIWVWITGQ